MRDASLFFAFMFLFLISIFQTGCAKKQTDCVFYEDPLSNEEQKICEVADPLEPINRVVFVFNDRFYLWVLEPINKNIYKKIPEPVRDSIGNFFQNITAPARFIGAVAQGKGETAGLIANEFINNSLLGIGGIFDPVKFTYPDDEDIGQGLAYWGFGEGIYFVWPIFGPRTTRSTVGDIGGYFVSPVKYTDNFERTVLQSTDSLDMWSGFSKTYIGIMDGSVDKYTALKKAYVSRTREDLRK